MPAFYLPICAGLEAAAATSATPPFAPLLPRCTIRSALVSQMRNIQLILPSPMTPACRRTPEHVTALVMNWSSMARYRRPAGNCPSSWKITSERLGGQHGSGIWPSPAGNRQGSGSRSSCRGWSFASSSSLTAPRPFIELVLPAARPGSGNTMASGSRPCGRNRLRACESGCMPQAFRRSVRVVAHFSPSWP